QSAPRRGRGPRGDPKAPGAGGLSGGAQARRDSGGGGQCVLRRDRRGTGAHVRPRRNGVATPGGARVRGSSPLGYARADPGGDARLSQATHGARRPRGPRYKMSDARLSQATHGARRPRGPRYKMTGVPLRVAATVVALALAVAPVSAEPSVSRRVLENGLTVLV